MTIYHRPTTLAAALAIRATTGAQVIAGGTDIYPARAARMAWGDPRHPPLLDVTAIPDLDGIEEDTAGWRIGCCVTWRALAQAALPPQFDGLRAAAREVGGRQVQNRGTLVGNLCTASPAGDGLPNLLVLDAEVEIIGRHGRRLLPVQEFLAGYRRVALEPDEIVLALRIPRLCDSRSAFHKLGARRFLVISIVMVAGLVAVDAAGRVAAARLAVGACSPVPLRLEALEQALLGQHASDMAAIVAAPHLAGLMPIDDVRASAVYRREAAMTLLRDLLRDLAS